MKKLNNPNLIHDYFEKIDTKDKAYWLGFLYADGWINIIKSKGIKRVCIELNKKDVCIIQKFIHDINGDEKSIHSRKNQYYISICSKKMFNDLESHGCVQRKSNIIELSTLESRELYLAYILGYYDGDGTINTTRITSGSEKFLDQVKKYFKIPFKIQEYDTYVMIENREIHSHGYCICLGSMLFNEMMDNYQDSLPRKRKYYNTNKIRNENIKKNAWRSRDTKFKITKDELEKLVWKKTAEQIAKEFGVSGSLITKKCRLWNIDKPKVGYWTTLKALQKSNKRGSIPVAKETDQGSVA